MLFYILFKWIFINFTKTNTQWPYSIIYFRLEAKFPLILPEHYHLIFAHLDFMFDRTLGSKSPVCTSHSLHDEISPAAPNRSMSFPGPLSHMTYLRWLVG